MICKRYTPKWSTVKNVSIPWRMRWPILPSVIPIRLTMPSMTRTAEEAVRLARKHGAEEAVVGLPLNMDGTEGARAATAHAFGDMLLKLSDGYIKAVHYCDERLSTVEAHGILSFSNVHSKKRKKVIDTLSAELILQYFLDEKRKSK